MKTSYRDVDKRPALDFSKSLGHCSQRHRDVKGLRKAPKGGREVGKRALLGDSGHSWGSRRACRVFSTAPRRDACPGFYTEAQEPRNRVGRCQGAQWGGTG